MGMFDRIRRRRNRRYGKKVGWKPDEKDSRDFTFDQLGLGDSRHQSFSLERHCGPMYNQGGTNSCVAQAFAGAIEVRESILGLERRTPSRLFMYWNARRAHGKQRYDFGTYLRLCAKMLNRVGVPDEEYWPFTSASLTVNRRPSWEASMRAHPRMGGRYFRIFDMGGARSQAIRAALESGFPVAFGTTVHSEFAKNDGSTFIQKPDSDSGKALGGHAMLIVGHMDDPAYGPVFRVRNSWGAAWRADGYAWLTAEYIEAFYSSDFQVIDGWSRIEGP
jgi:C1A family cysteine protease